ncbi:MAG TPA: LytTR family DNA-binding domain-containing protein [Bryobacteraceae bacterium]|nr:LytTR family DNA-binding domain-containing protein [Bryobacteraceae bacterium]
MRALIVDDEPVARRVLREELELVADVEVAAEAESGTAALEEIKTVQPDLMFLDLQMPGLDGFGVIRALTGGVMPVIIIVTAYDQYAVQAFEAGAIDYLLKPVSADRLAVALERSRRIARKPREVAEHIAQLQQISPNQAAPVTPRKIVGRAGEEYFLLTPEEVLAFQAEGDVVWIVTVKRRYQATLTLRALQTRLQGLPFLRIHRNALVNITHVRKMAALSSQRWLLTMHNNQEFIVSKRQAGAVRHLLSW